MLRATMSAGILLFSASQLNFSESIQIMTIQARTSSGQKAMLKEIPIFKADNAILYTVPIMAVDLDGAPNAYHPPTPEHPHGKGPGLGLEDLRNASRNLDDGPNAQWVGIVTDKQGKPIIQTEGPFTGFYVSKTSLEDRRFAIEDPRRYADATKIPYVVLNPILRRNAGVDLGDLAAVVLDSPNHEISFGIVADIGPSKGLGECSKALANSINRPNGAEGTNITYVFFPNRDGRRIRTREQIINEGQALFAAWGGLGRVQSLADSSEDR
jgi:Fungal chitosanase of glycosyl hydrolase group 75